MPFDTAPRVTVFIPAYNAESFIGEAIESVLAQTFSDFELLIIDDASTDATLAMAQLYTVDDRIRVLSHQHNQGTPQTRNHGLDQARGEYIALLDADDICMPDRLERQVEYLDSHTNIDVLGGYFYKIDATGLRRPKRPKRRPFTDPDDIEADTLLTCPIQQPTIMARRRILASWRYDPNSPAAEDYDLWSRMVAHHNFANLPVELIAYRRHPAQSTSVDVAAINKIRLIIATRLLDALGVDYSDSDLRKHSLLDKGVNQHKPTTGQSMDRDYMIWAEYWLRGLIAANAKSRRYPSNSLLRVVGDKWWHLCRKASRREAVGPAVWLIFARSPLKMAVLTGFYQKILNIMRWTLNRFCRKGGEPRVTH